MFSSRSIHGGEFPPSRIIYCHTYIYTHTHILLEQGINEELEELLKDPNFSIKVVVVGTSKCGKTCLCWRFAKSEFPDNVSPTTDTNIHSTTVEINDKKVKEELWDVLSKMSLIGEYY